MTIACKMDLGWLADNAPRFVAATVARRGLLGTGRASASWYLSPASPARNQGGRAVAAAGVR
jgi:hypothetical protein